MLGRRLHNHHALLLMALSTGLAGCTESLRIQEPSQNVLAPQPVVLRSMLQGVSSPSTLQEEFKMLAQNMPGFAGVFLDNGELTVSVATDDFPARSLQRVVDWARGYSSGARRSPSVKVRRVRYDYNQLLSQFDAINASLSAEDGLRSISIDESLGKVRLGISLSTSRASIQARIVSQGTPGDMVVIEEVEEAHPDATLNQIYRPVVGGLQIAYPGNPGPSPCTIGFNLYRQADDGFYPDVSQGLFFTTASHCSPTPGTVGGLTVYQPTASPSTKIGVEVDHAPILWGYPCPPLKIPCQWADILIVKYLDSIAVGYGAVANVNSSKTIIGYYNIQGTVSGSILGDPVTFVGQAGGKKTGRVTETCVTKQLTGVWQVCQYKANYAAVPGDSGGPVFVPYSAADPIGTPRVVGSHVSTAGTDRYFAPIAQIASALSHAYYWF